MPDDPRLEAVRRAFEGWNAGGTGPIVGVFAEDGEVVTAASFPEGGTFRGHEQIRAFFAGLHEGWIAGGAVTLQDHRWIGDKLLTTFEWRATGEASGVETSSQWTGVYTFRDGLITRLEYYAELEDAVAAASD